MAYKQEHQKFITGHNGTTYQEVAMIASISCIGCLARDLCLLLAIAKVIRPRLLMEFTLMVLPNVLGVTLLSDHIGSLHFIFISATVFLGLHLLFLKRQTVRASTILHQINLDNRKPFITYFRSMVNLSTAIAILAVDFPVFPRRLAKSEIYGFGGMDIGVGFFVVANAIVSSEARGKYKLLPFMHQMKQAFISTLPLLIIGSARLLAVKGVDYHEHVTEYGVHWNFFFTLAALRITSTLVFCMISVSKSAIGAAAIVAIHQTLLSNGMSSYIVNGVDGAGGRIGLFDANREGIYSLPGYTAIYMFGVQLGSFIFKPRQNLKEWLDVAKQLILIFVVCTGLMAALHSTVEPVSRRFANAAFVLWVLSQSCLMILECLLADIFITFIKSAWQVSPKQASGTEKAHDRDMDETLLRSRSKAMQSSNFASNRVSDESVNKMDLGDDCMPASEICLMDAIGYNSLLFFLLANLFTGVVNMSITTIYASDAAAVVIMILYMYTLCFIVVNLRRRNISTKIW